MVFDILVVLAILGAIALGYWKGFAWQLAAIFSLVLGFVVAIPASKPLASFFGASAPLNRFMALAALYTVVSLGVYVAALFYRKTIERWELHHWDRHMGAVLGALKGLLFCMMLTFFAITLFSGLREPILRTTGGKLMGRTMMVLEPVFPEATHDIIHPYVHHLDPPAPAPAPPPPPAPQTPR